VKVRVLEQRNPAYDGGFLERCRALYCGGDKWREHLNFWLPKHSEEMDDTYKERKARALYENNVGPIVDVLASGVFAEAPTVEGFEGTGDWLAKFQANVDNEGTPLGPWFRERLKDALVECKVYAWVNLPRRADGIVYESRADEEAAGVLDAFLVPFTARQVIDWERDESGRLAWLMVRDVVERRGAIEETRRKVHRWTYIDRERIRRWTWAATETQEEPKPEDDAKEEPSIPHGLKELPVACLELVPGLHALGKLHDPAVAHIRGRNDLSWALHRAAHALLWIKSKWDDHRPTLGPGYYAKLGENDDIGYAEPSGSNFQLLADDVVQLREALYRVVQQMAIGADSNATRSKMSGESKAQDWAAMDIVLSALAGAVRTFMVDALRLVAKARGVEASPVVKGLDGWREEDLTVWLQAAALATEAFRLSPTFQKEVAKSQAARVLRDVDAQVLETITKEIDAAEADPGLYMPPPPPEPPDEGEDADEDEATA
jgi:hypothetical protein